MFLLLESIKGGMKLMKKTVFFFTVAVTLLLKEQGILKLT
ncbi:hypothetical protein Amet_4678 [Alkaliphilus metalliredigens QYMF]|uniref:Uncharacterized protein n=1 Tax=Alkaliphilus metalliredigens (strain QYMF) TaxID=293826 RepID=A6TX28_ALKMQ|nr:hypothetical protein Amet_4678 [Alkaliphilus metalliredigens QYMF]